jgi:hypothetical protein
MSEFNNRWSGFSIVLLLVNLGLIGYELYSLYEHDQQLDWLEQVNLPDSTTNPLENTPTSFTFIYQNGTHIASARISMDVYQYPVQYPMKPMDRVNGSAKLDPVHGGGSPLESHYLVQFTSGFTDPYWDTYGNGPQVVMLSPPLNCSLKATPDNITLQCHGGSFLRSYYDYGSGVFIQPVLEFYNNMPMMYGDSSPGSLGYIRYTNPMNRTVVEMECSQVDQIVFCLGIPVNYSVAFNYGLYSKLTISIETNSTFF